MAKCWKYKLLIRFCKPYHIPICCVGCKWAKNNQCTKHTRTPKEKTIKTSRWLIEGMTEEQIQKAKAEAIMQAKKELARVKKERNGEK